MLTMHEIVRGIVTAHLASRTTTTVTIDSNVSLSLSRISVPVVIV